MERTPIHTISYPGGSSDFCSVGNKVYAGAAFTAPEGSLCEVSLWLSVGNDDCVKIDVLNEGMYGFCIASVLLPAGDAGKRTVLFLNPVPLNPGKTYLIRVSAGAPGLTCCTLCAFEGTAPPDCRSFIGYKQQPAHMAMEIVFTKSSKINAPKKEDPENEPGYREKVDYYLSQKTDAFGEEIIRSGGATYEKVKGFLHPTMLAGTILTESGVYYIPFGRPKDPAGGGESALCVADGSQIVSNTADGQKITFYVGYDGNEMFGGSLSRLMQPELLQGYLPILLNRYTDGEGNYYEKETLANPCGDCGLLVSYTKITISGKSHAGTSLRIRTEYDKLTAQGGEIYAGGKLYIICSAAPRIMGRDLLFDIPLTCGNACFYLARFNLPCGAAGFVMDEARYNFEKADCVQYWKGRLDNKSIFDVPEDLVMKAQKSLLIQNIFMGWRYSIGNIYECFYQPESSDMAEILGTYGFNDLHRAILTALLPMYKSKASYQNWERGEKLAHAASYTRLHNDYSFILEHREAYYKILDILCAQINKNENHLLNPEAPCGDLNEPALYTPTLCVAWRGMTDVVQILMECNDKKAHSYLAPLRLFTEALKKGIDESVIEIDDDTVFLPKNLYPENRGWFDPITDTKLGTYWNLTIPYALSARFIPYSSPMIKKLYRYMKEYGTWLCGMIRTNFYPTPVGQYVKSGLPGYASTGTDNVYAVNLAEFVAHMDDPERLILMFYGKLAHGMTRGTFISGEGDTVGVCGNQYYRSMYQPPNGANNSFFLKLLRLMLITEHYSDSSEPSMLCLSPATPPAWQEHGKTITVKNAPTVFGPVSYTQISRIRDRLVRIRLSVPERNAIQKLLFFVRVPGRLPVSGVTVNGLDHKAFTADGALNLSGLRGMLDIKVTF